MLADTLFMWLFAQELIKAMSKPFFDQMVGHHLGSLLFWPLALGIFLYIKLL